MKRSLFLMVFLMTVLSLAAAGDDWVFSVNTFMESEEHPGVYSGSDMILAPGIGFGLANSRIGYFKYTFENRNRHSSSDSESIGDEMRSKFQLGRAFSFGSVTFRPEYELRMKNYKKIHPGDQAVYENRFHLNTAVSLDGGWSVFLNLMPTCTVSVDPGRAAETDTYIDYYQEAELGGGYQLTPAQSLGFSVYNEMELKEQTEAGGTVNNGGTFKFYEFQLRVKYSYLFGNGIRLTPFARIGLLKKSFQQDAGSEYENNNRRDRFGLQVGYTAENGLRTFGEFYYQRENMESLEVEADPRQRILWKLGMEYSF